MNTLNKNILPNTKDASVDRVYAETKELATKCAKALGTPKTLIYWLSVKEFYEKHVAEGENELVS